MVFWDNKNEVFDLVKSCWNVPDDIFNLPKQFVYDPDAEYPYAVKTSVDIDTGESGQIKYNVINNRSNQIATICGQSRDRDLTKIHGEDYENLYMFQPQYAVEVKAEGGQYWLPYGVGCL